MSTELEKYQIGYGVLTTSCYKLLRQLKQTSFFTNTLGGVGTQESGSKSLLPFLLLCVACKDPGDTARADSYRTWYSSRHAFAAVLHGF